MTLEEKREIIVKNKDPALAALEAVSDRIYDITDPLLNDKGKIMSIKIGSYKAEQFVQSLRDDSEKYENVREKLLSGDFNLSLSEINYVALAFHFCSERMKEQIKSLEKAIELSDSIVKDLMSTQNNESEN